MIRQWSRRAAETTAVTDERSAHGPHRHRDDAVLGLAGRVVVDDGELAVAVTQDHRLDGGVSRTRCGGLAVGHDDVHHHVAEFVHLLVGEVVRARCVAVALAATGQVDHPLDEVEPSRGLVPRTSGLLHDLVDGGVVEGLDQRPRDDGRVLYLRCGHRATSLMLKASGVGRACKLLL